MTKLIVSLAKTQKTKTSFTHDYQSNHNESQAQRWHQQWHIAQRWPVELEVSKPEGWVWFHFQTLQGGGRHKTRPSTWRLIVTESFARTESGSCQGYHQVTQKHSEWKLVPSADTEYDPIYKAVRGNPNNPNVSYIVPHQRCSHNFFVVGLLKKTPQYNR